MTTVRHETQITAETEAPLIRVTREFDAPPAKVFRAHRDPELFAKWGGPNDVETRVDDWDCRTGGSYRYTCIEGQEEHRFRGTFHEIRPDELIVQTFTYEPFPDSVLLEKIAFEELDNGRTRLVSTSVFESFEERDGFLASGAEAGVRDGYEKLDALL